MKHNRVLLLALMFPLSAVVLADDAAPTTAPTTVPATAPAIVPAANKDALTAAVDKVVTVEGTVASGAWSSSGKVFLIKFADTNGSEFSAVVFSKNKEEMEKAFDGDIAKAITGAKVRVRGSVKLFKEHPEIVIDRPDQLQVIEKAKAS